MSVPVAGESHSLVIRSSLFDQDRAVEIGESVAVNGVCLTVVKRSEDSAVFDVSTETLRCTSLGALKSGNETNVELSLRLGDLLNGHLVQGHVDGTAALLRIEPEESGLCFTFELPEWARPYLVMKGSIALDGISLTVGRIESDSFSVFIIPHTLDRTTFRNLRPGDLVNVELDCVAKYLAGFAAPYQREAA